MTEKNTKWSVRRTVQSKVTSSRATKTWTQHKNHGHVIENEQKIPSVFSAFQTQIARCEEETGKPRMMDEEET